MDVARENGTVIVVPVYEVEHSGVFYNTAAVIDADGRYLGKHRKNHIPQVAGFWEKFYFRPGNLGIPYSTRRSVGSASTSATSVTSPRVGGPSDSRARRSSSIPPRPAGGCPSTSGGWSSLQLRWRTSTSWVRSTRVGVEPLGTNEFYGQSYFVDPRGQFVGEVASDVDEAVVVRDLDLGLIDDVRRIWAFYRDRRPETYNQLCEA